MASCDTGQPHEADRVNRISNVDFQIEIVPRDGIGLPIGTAATSVRRRFLGSSQSSRLLGQEVTYHSVQRLTISCPSALFHHRGGRLWPIAEMAVARVGGRLLGYCGRNAYP